MQSLRYWYIVTGSSFCVSFLLSLIVLFRYRSIQKRASGGFTADINIEKSPAKIKAPEQPVPAVVTLHDKPAAVSALPVESDFEPVIAEPVGETFIEKDYEIPVGADYVTDEEMFPELKTNPDKKGSEGYITVEFLGDIQDEPAVPVARRPASGDYIARTISVESLGEMRSKKIRDAIPAGRKR